jgi:hypothetical protein
MGQDGIDPSSIFCTAPLPVCRFALPRKLSGGGLLCYVNYNYVNNTLNFILLTGKTQKYSCRLSNRQLYAFILRKVNSDSLLFAYDARP